MIKHICDACGMEVDKEYFFGGLPFHRIETKTDENGINVLSTTVQTRTLDLCSTCLHLYQNKLNRLFDDFTNNVKNKN